MGFGDAVRTVLTARYAAFSGRAPRSEYWWFALFAVILSVVVSMLGAIGGALGDVLELIVGLGLLIPSMAVGVRRLHDIHRTGWWILIGIVPLIGTIVLIVFFVTPGTPGPNRFGPDPLGDVVAHRLA